MATWLRRRASGDREQGAIAVLVAILAIVLFGFAAYAVDIGNKVAQRQKLQNTLDAAALAGVHELPDMAKATAAVTAFFTLNDPSTLNDPNIIAPTPDYWCIVAATSAATPAVDTTQIPGVCNPGAAPYTAAHFPGLVCTTTLCYIPCVVALGCTAPNAMNLSTSRTVPFLFGGPIGQGSGTTGSVSSAACSGSCGAAVPNPMNVVVVGDRTSSMSTSDRNAMVAAIKSMLGIMNPSIQYVALGTIGKSLSTSGCITAPSLSSTTTGAKWIPTTFSNTYQSSPLTDQVIQGLTCLTSSSSGTDLASPMKYAARYLLNYDTNNISSLPVRSGTPRNAIIFETDGQPNESTVAGSTAIATAGDIGNSNGATACTNFATVATNAKSAGILIATIGFGAASTKDCTGSSTHATYLAAAASPNSAGVASKANTDCGTTAGRTAENTDGDLYFCAAAGADMQAIFATAISTLSGNSRLIKLP
jgi:Flp pilus assembly protein TadG